MPLITAASVFEFVGAAADVITNNSARITTLIAQMELQLESDLGRKIATTAATNVLFEHGENCQIQGNKIWFKGQYRDITSISAFTENGVTVSAISSYTETGAYSLNPNLGCVTRNGQDWAPLPFGIKISGSYGLQGRTELYGKAKQILLEMVAAKSGYWTMNFETEEGTFEKVRTNISADAKAAKASLKLKDIV